MLKRLRIKNFQGHKSFKLKFDPHVTTIVGPSDIGKSAILRAIMWAVLNKPRGASFLHTGADEVSVTLKLKDHKITRTRGKTNTYHLNGHKFAAFGHDVPTEISNVLKLNENINFQDQHLGGSFWFKLSPGEVSRQLNQIVDLSVIDTTLAHIAGEIRKSRMERGIVEGRLEEARKDRGKLRSAKKADRALKAIEELDAHSTKLRRRCASLKRLLEKAVGHRDDTNRCLARLATARKTVELGGTWEYLVLRSLSLDGKLRQLGHAQLHTKTKIPKLKRFQKLAEEWGKLRVSRLRLMRLTEGVRRATNDKNVALISAQSTLNKIQREIGDVCPLCQSVIPS